MKKGVFLISLDFELFWGVRDKFSLQQYGNNILAVHTVIPRLLALFSTYGIHATWATLGFLFFSDEKQLKTALPEVLPDYENEILNPYPYLDTLDLADKRYHFAPELIAMIHATAGQEIASHTFSHYYCLEKGQNKDSFASDIASSVAVSLNTVGISPTSIIFPRNQLNTNYLDLLTKQGILCYRGNEESYFHIPDNTAASKLKVLFKRAVRLFDSHIRILGHFTYSTKACDEGGIFNFRASKYLRPFNKTLFFLEPLKRNRIKRSMTKAAKNR
ncbi:MAG: polysaccharide deacetylase family protein [Sphaerochaetaceae bacterium]